MAKPQATARSDLSVVVTTYNRSEALSCVLASLSKQDCLPGEVVVADDGSGVETARCIAYWGKRAPFPIHHVWQPDQGFRAAQARNRAVARSKGRYLIFLDGDCLVFPDFVRRHKELAEPGWFVVGNRVLVSADLTGRIVQGKADPLQWDRWRWVLARTRGEVNRLLPLLRWPLLPWRKWQARKWQGARTCNLALWREDFFAINGFDERYQGWGHEDADLTARLFHLGHFRKEGRFAVPVVHLWHPENDRRKEAANLARLQGVLDDRNVVRAARGLDQYLLELGVAE